MIRDARDFTPDVDKLLREPTIGSRVVALDDTGRFAVDADGRLNEGDPTLINCLPFSEYVRRPDARQRYEMMAETLHARVLTIDNPGMQSDKMPRALKRELKTGNFRSLANEKWDISRELLGGKIGRVGLIGYSLGAAEAAAMAATRPADARIDDLTLWEPVGAAHATPLKLGINFSKEALDWHGYKKEQPDWVKEPGKTGSLPLSYVRGLAHAPIVPDIEAALGQGSITPRTNVNVVTGTRSRISPVESTLRLNSVLRLHAIGGKTLWLLDQSHGLIDSPGRVSSVLQELDKPGFI